MRLDGRTGDASADATPGLTEPASTAPDRSPERRELELRETIARLEDFAYVASHELKSPLRGIRNLAERVHKELKNTASPEASRDLDRILVRVERTERIIDELLTHARGRDASADVAWIHPQRLLADLIELEAPGSFDVSLEILIEPFLAARAPLEIVLRNLISNAVKHHDRDRGRVAIKVSGDGSYCHIEVSDDGPGIPSEFRKRLFEPSETVSGSERGESRIGLALSKRLVESNGGKIELVSSGGRRGSTFHVWWPGSCEQAVSDDRAPERVDGHGAKPP